MGAGNDARLGPTLRRIKLKPDQPRVAFDRIPNQDASQYLVRGVNEAGGAEVGDSVGFGPETNPAAGEGVISQGRNELFAVEQAINSVALADDFQFVPDIFVNLQAR